MKALRIALVLGAVQAALIVGYLGIDAMRTGPSDPFTWEPLEGLAPSLTVESAEGPRALPEGPVLVHFWATWCGPCQAELPALLEASRSSGVPLLAVTDEPWPVVERYFSGSVPPAIVRDPTGDGAVTWGVSGLPDTFVVADARLVGRMGGPRDWESAGARRFLSALGAGSTER